jgi:hypothetical protein
MSYEYNQIKDKLEEIRAAEADGKLELNDWEANFIDGVFENFKWTGRQKYQIDEIHGRID